MGGQGAGREGGELAGGRELGVDEGRGRVVRLQGGGRVGWRRPILRGGAQGPARHVGGVIRVGEVVGGGLEGRGRHWEEGAGRQGVVWAGEVAGLDHAGSTAVLGLQWVLISVCSVVSV